MGSPTKSKVLAIAPKFTSFLSICGSLGIIFMVLRSSRRRKKTMHRIMLGMSISDLLASTWYFAGTWVIPVGTLSWFGNGTTDTIFWAAGDQNGVTCGIGGFFNQLAICTPLYNGTLALYYLLAVYFGWDDRRVSRIEWFFHLLPWGYASFTAIFAASTDLYGHVEWTCWVLPDEAFDDNKDISPVQNKFQMIQWIFLFGMVWACIAFVSIVFVALYRKMKQLEKKMKGYRMSIRGMGSSSRLARVTDASNSDRLKQKESDGDADEENDGPDRDLNEINQKITDDISPDIEEGEVTISPEDNIHSEKLKTALVASTAEGKVSESEHFGDECSNREEEEVFEDNNKNTETTAGISYTHNCVSEKGLASEDQRRIEKKEILPVSWITQGEQSTDDEFNEEGSSSIDKCRNGHSSIKKLCLNDCGGNTVPTSIIETKKYKSIRSTWLASFYQPNNSGSGGVNERPGTSILSKHSFKRHLKSRKIAIQGMLYVAAFYVTWLFPTISRITELVAGKNYFVIQFLDTFLIPLQGFFNICIYIRPRLIIHRQKNPAIGFWRAFRDVLLETD